MNEEVENQRKKPHSQIEAEDRKVIENKKKKFREFVAVMTAKGSKSKSSNWNESFNDFVPQDLTKSRRERKRDEKQRKDQKEQEKEQQEEDDAPKVVTTKIIEADKGVTIVEKEINKKSTKLGKSKAKSLHIKFGQDADIDNALEKIEDQIPAVEESNQEEQKKTEEEENDEIDENRLYIMNLPFSITDLDIREYFGKYGEIEEISIPLKAGGVGTGFCFIRFTEPESAVNAFANLDKKIFQGRILTILPASKKKEKPKKEFGNEEWRDPESRDKNDHKFDQERSSFKQERKFHIKRNFDDETNWNYLFMNRDTVTEIVANNLAVKKGDILNKDDDNLAVRVANIETQIIKETKEWLISQGIDLKAIEGKNDRLTCKRSHDTILIKNISPKCQEQDLTEMFERYGKVQLMFNPTISIAKYNSANRAETGMYCLLIVFNLFLYSYQKVVILQTS